MLERVVLYTKPRKIITFQFNWGWGQEEISRERNLHRKCHESPGIQFPWVTQQFGSAWQHNVEGSQG